MSEGRPLAGVLYTLHTLFFNIQARTHFNAEFLLLLSLLLLCRCCRQWLNLHRTKKDLGSTHGVRPLFAIVALGIGDNTDTSNGIVTCNAQGGATNIIMRFCVVAHCGSAFFLPSLMYRCSPQTHFSEFMAYPPLSA